MTSRKPPKIIIIPRSDHRHINALRYKNAMPCSTRSIPASWHLYSRGSASYHLPQTCCEGCSVVLILYVHPNNGARLLPTLIRDTIAYQNDRTTSLDSLDFAEMCTCSKESADIYLKTKLLPVGRCATIQHLQTALVDRLTYCSISRYA